MKLTILVSVLGGFIVWSSANAQSSTGGFRTITNIYLNKGWVNFYLDENCPLGKPYYQLDSAIIDVDRYYSTLLSAFYAGVKVKVGWDEAEYPDRCKVSWVQLEK